jgi:DNA-binding transcriptional ArsR family regulator
MLTELFVSQVRVEIIKLFLRDPSLGIHIRAICRAVGAEINAVRRELDNLTKIGLLRKEKSGNKIYYQVRPDFVLLDELLGMVVKTTGLGKGIVENAKEFGAIEFAFVAKEFAKGRRSGSSEVDLFMVGKVNVGKLERLIRDEQERLGREINYTLLTPEEFDFRRRRKDPFLVNVLKQPKIVLLGDEEKFTNV